MAYRGRGRKGGKDCEPRRLSYSLLDCETREDVIQVMLEIHDELLNVLLRSLNGAA